jgi:uncharacterized membrane protein YciS (DUF1049 family)
MLKGPFSISLRLTAWFCGIFFLGWVLFGTAMWFTLKRTLKDERYQTLSRRMDRLQQVLAKSAGEDEDDRTREFTELAPQGMDWQKCIGSTVSAHFLRRRLLRQPLNGLTFNASVLNDFSM